MEPLSIRYSRSIFVFFLTLIFWIVPFSGTAQKPNIDVWIYFSDKEGEVFNAGKYFTDAGLDRRKKRHLPIGDFYDLPVSEKYVKSISPFIDTLYYRSRWLNAVAASIPSGNLQFLSGFEFVKGHQPIGRMKALRSVKDSSVIFNVDRRDSLLLRFQLKRMQGQEFSKRNLDGRGITIAVFDVGFKNVDIHPAFKHLFDRDAIKATYDFVGDDDNVYTKGNHGTAVLGCIAGMFDTIPMGLATGADFLLARTERALMEVLAEEYNWIAAAEWADRHGADIISSSLGYSETRYFQENMDGKTAPISKAASVAARKGILILNAAGNEGDNSWGTIVAPSDADSVMTIGGIDPFKDLATSFSSYGPAADGTTKPNLTNLGTVFSSSARKFSFTQGTSFSTPLTSGFAACAWQEFSELNNMQIFEKLEKSGHLYPYFDFVHGYGIPQANKLFDSTKTDATFVFELTDDYLEVEVDTSFIPGKDKEGEFLSFPKNMFYKIVNPEGRIRKYGVVLVESKQPLYFEIGDLYMEEKIVVHFEGFTHSITIEK